MLSWILVILVGGLSGFFDGLRDNRRDYYPNDIMSRWKGGYWKRTPEDRTSWKRYGSLWLTDRAWEIIQDPFHLVKALCIVVLIFGGGLFVESVWQALAVLFSFQIAFELTYH